ncbi:MAG: FIST C-terminal domain-containing protein [Candidatus Omnitrophica bacterium]|nr:FIST C-terminal domain-containing protein [Candidatus Omnitrophota bacterium]
MATIVGLGLSTKLDSFGAGREAAQGAYYQVKRQTPNLIIVFISTIFSQVEAMKGIRSIMRESPLIGCSSAGSIVTTGIFRNSVSVFAIRSDSISFSLSMAKRVSKNARSAGYEVANQAFTKSSKEKTTKAFMMFSDSLSGNGADILRGAQEVLGTSFPIIGGSAADELRFQKTYQYLNNSIYTDSIAGLLISGDIDIVIGKAHGWQPIGKPHRITKARSNIIREIDGRTAVELYEEYFGKSLEELKNYGIGKLGISYPLGIRMKGKNEYLIRAPLRLEDSGSLVLNAEIPEGEDVNLMMGDKNLCLDATRDMCSEVNKDIYARNISFVTVFSDIARYNLLRNNAREEIEIIKEHFGKNTPIIGCYTYGQYSSPGKYEYKGWSNFHNQALSIAVFSEHTKK